MRLRSVSSWPFAGGGRGANGPQCTQHTSFSRYFFRGSSSGIAASYMLLRIECGHDVTCSCSFLCFASLQSSDYRSWQGRLPSTSMKNFSGVVEVQTCGSCCSLQFGLDKILYCTPLTLEINSPAVSKRLWPACSRRREGPQPAARGLASARAAPP